ncbi:hypothetical protein [Croceicoccus hydrothermalis]|uniref:hypothetical protein n=1 Tax=Croceicoccus hydrothermalis TaxID=2867964 RepID=UPI00308409EA
MGQDSTGEQLIAEMRVFAAFDPAEQRYIRRSLDIAFERHDPYERYARTSREAVSIRQQIMAYKDIGELRGMIPTHVDQNVDLFFGRLVRMTVFNLCEGCISRFDAYRFLYERMLGPNVRLWLPASFCAVAAMPKLPPERRARLLKSISEDDATASGWSSRRPQFVPTFVRDRALVPQPPRALRARAPLTRGRARRSGCHNVRGSCAAGS